MKKHYAAPELVEYGTVAELTAALGSGGQQDFSDFPDTFPADTGSINVCGNPLPPDTNCP